MFNTDHRYESVECIVHGVLVYDAFLKNYELVVKVQRAWLEFNIRRSGAVSNRKTTMRWDTVFRTTEIITATKTTDI